MEDQEYHNIYALEDTHWWYVALRRLVLASLKGYAAGSQNMTLLDAGCGAGGVALELSKRFKRVVGVDLSPIGLSLSRKRGISELINCSVSALPLKDKDFNVVVSLDVIYHMGVSDDVTALREFNRVLKDDGLLILNLPAFEYLSSHHDRVAHTRERYTKAGLERKLHDAGFEIERVTYWNAFLFPVVLIVRTAQKILGSEEDGGKSDLRAGNPLINLILTSILSLERFLLKFTCLPFGSSLFCVARKRGLGRK